MGFHHPQYRARGFMDTFFILIVLTILAPIYANDTLDKRVGSKIMGLLWSINFSQP